MKIAGIVIVLLGAVTVYFSAGFRKLLFPREENAEATYDMKENLIKLVGVVIAIAGVLMVMYAK